MLDESLCKKCALCCSFHVKLKDGDIIMPTFVCNKLGPDNLCTIYETRTCAKGQKILDKGMIPKTCGYAHLAKKHREVASLAGEFVLYRLLDDRQIKELLSNFKMRKT